MVLEVHYRDPPGLNPDFLTNLSDGGTFINSNAPFTVGQRVEVSISSPKLPEPLKIAGHIRWRRVADAENPGGVGIEFIFEEQDQNDAIDRLLRRKKKKA